MSQIIKSLVLALLLSTFFSTSQAQSSANKYGLLQKIKVTEGSDVLDLIKQSGKGEIDGILFSNREDRQESSDGRTYVTLRMQAEIGKFEDEDAYKLVKKIGAELKKRLQEQKAEVKDVSGRAQDLNIDYKSGCIVG
jgi:hypothetical protein